MEHFIYKITNTLNGRFYIGMHSTKNSNDGYLGSGKRIKAEVNKYGKENFRKEIVERVPSRKILKEREAEIVNAELLSNPLCLNLVFGGEGGWETYNTNSDLQRDKAIRGHEKQRLLKETNPEWADKRSESCRKATTQRHRDGIMPPPPDWSGKTHKEESKIAIGKKNSEHQTGAGNSQFGKCWVTDGIKSVSIKKEHLNEYLSKGFVRGRKM